MILTLKNLFNRSLAFGTLALCLPIVSISAAEQNLLTKNCSCEPAKTCCEAGSPGPRGCKGKKGPQGERGPRGHAGADGVNFEFPLDLGQSLTFNFTIDAFNAPLSSLGTGSTITPFVIRPDALVILGVPYTIESTGAFPLESIVINNPLFGTYNVGVQTFNGNDNPYSMTLLGTATASRDNSLTYLLNGAGLGLNLSFSGAQTQTSANFGYFLPIPSLLPSN